MAAVGIDLGTTFSGVCHFRNGVYEKLTADEGSIPSILAFTDDETEPYVGKEAEELQELIPENCIYDVKRFIGCDPTDPFVQETIGRWPFKIVTGDNKLQLEVVQQGNRRSFSPEEVCGMLLKYLLRKAEERLGQEITLLVVSIPAYFSMKQRDATKMACSYAGHEEVKLITEPVAAAYSAPFKVWKENQLILVYDFGGGTFDVCISRVTNRIMKSISIDGHQHLGGRDLDAVLMQYVCETFKNKENREVGNDASVLASIRRACEWAKRRLSTENVVIIAIPMVAGVEQWKMRITRSTFEELISPLVNKTIAITRDALHHAHLTPNDITTVLLVGGSSRIPLVKDKMKQMFPSAMFSNLVDTDLAVMKGAAKWAAYLANYSDLSSDPFTLSDVRPFSIGISDSDGKMCRLFQPNTRLPQRIAHYGTTSKDNQTVIRIKIYEGNQINVSDNFFLDELIIENLQSKKAGEVAVFMNFHLNEQGTLTVDASAKDKTGQQLSCTTRFSIYNRSIPLN